MARDFEIEWRFAGKGGAFQTKNVTDVCAAAKRGVKEMKEQLLKRMGDNGDLDVDYPGGAFSAKNVVAIDLNDAISRASTQILKKCCESEAHGAKVWEDRVGWTIRKYPDRLVKAIANTLPDKQNFGYLLSCTRRQWPDLEISERDMAGIISYVLSHNVQGVEKREIDKEMRAFWAKEVFGKAKVGEVTRAEVAGIPSGYTEEGVEQIIQFRQEEQFLHPDSQCTAYIRYVNALIRDKKVGSIDSLGHGHARGPTQISDKGQAIAENLVRGEGVTPADIIEYLREVVYDKEGKIGLDEMEKYLSREEVGMVGTGLIKVVGEPVSSKVIAVLKRKGLLPTLERELRKDAI